MPSVRFQSEGLTHGVMGKLPVLSVDWQAKEMRDPVNIFQNWSRARIYRWAACFTFILLGPSVASAQNWGAPAWSDEFSGPPGTPIDTTKWSFDTGILNVNNEVEYYCAPGMTAGGCNSTQPNAYIDGNDHLVIRALKLNASTTLYSRSWTSARMTTKGTKQFQYGRAEAKMMLPVGPEIWPAFWALGSNISTAGWPGCGEMDYLENVPASAGQGPTKISSTIHGPGYFGANGLSRQYTFPSGDVTGFHTYGAIWSPNMVQFYVDNPANIFFVRTASDVPASQTWVFNHPFFLLMNLALGGDGSWPGPTDTTTPNPAVMTVDYVRIYQAAAVPSPSMGNPPAISIKAGATTGNASTFSIGNAVGSGRVYLACKTTAPNATCQVSTNDTLNANTLDFSTSATGMVTVKVLTTANALVPPTSLWRRIYGVAQFVLLALLGVMAVRFAVKWRRTLRPADVLGTALLAGSAILLGCAGGNSAMTPPGSGTTPGNYSIIVSAYTVSGDGANPDATASVPLSVN